MMHLDCKTCGFGPLKNGKCRFAGECPNKEAVSVKQSQIPSTDVELAIAESVVEVAAPELACVPSSLCVGCAYSCHKDGIGCVYPAGLCIVSQGLCR
jgi:hypothetical protein